MFLTTEIVIIGGSNAGLSAALTLGRARRNVLVVDDGKPRNAEARFAYGYFTRDKTPPADLLAIGREQLAPYDVTLHDGRVTKATPVDQGFHLETERGDTIHALKIILATGLVDELSDIPGLKECWGKTVFSCPYCDGWELRDKQLAIIAQDAGGYGFSLLMQQWSADVVLCTNGFTPHDWEKLEYLKSQNITVIDQPITHLADCTDTTQAICFADGTRIERHGIFLHPNCHLRNEISRHLNCQLVENGHHLVVDDEGRTSVPGVYAAGDIAAKHSQVAIAVASGVTAAYAVNDDLIRDRHG